MTKYTVGLLVLGILSGFTLTQKRYLLKSYWFAAGSGIALAIFLPNLLWQAHHEFISWQFLQFIHQRDIRLGRTDGFIWKQLVVCVNVYAVPLCATGIVTCWRNPRYRPVTSMLQSLSPSFYLAKASSTILALPIPSSLRQVRQPVRIGSKPGPRDGESPCRQPSSWRSSVPEPTPAPLFCPSLPAARSCASLSETTTPCAKNWAGRILFDLWPPSAIPCLLTNGPASESWWGTTVNRAPSKCSVHLSAFPFPSA